MKENEETNEKELFVGFDIGSSSLHYVVLDEKKNILLSAEPIMHFANPNGAIKEAWQDITEKFPGRIKSTAFTGSGAKFFTEIMPELIYEYDSVTIPKGAELIAPDAEYIFHSGTKDNYFFNPKRVNNKTILQEWKTGTKCGGGSGASAEK